MLMKKGKVFLVGAGPGDPQLMTVKGLQCIKFSDVIVYDRLVNEELLKEAKLGAELVFCGKFPNNHVMRQEQINELLVVKALEGKIVTRLKGGDPCVFGRVGEEAQALNQHDIAFEIVPGVTSGIAAPAYAGIPVTHRDHSSSFAMITGHLTETENDEQKWRAYATGIDTLTFYMGVKNLPTICEKLIFYGKASSTPVAVIEWGTTTRQRTVVGTLETIPEIAMQENITHPSIIIVGDVVNLRQEVKWFELEHLGEKRK